MDGSSPVLFEVGTGDKSSIAQLTVVRARFARRCHGRQCFLQGAGSPHQGQSADTMSSVECECSVGKIEAEEGCKERFVEWRGAKSLLRGRGAEEGRDVVSCMGGAKGRKTGAKQKKGRRGAKLTQEDIELIDIPDHAGLYDFSELSRSSVNPSSTSVTHQEEDCALRMELAGQLVPGQPHYIAAVDNEVLSSSHQGRQKDFEDQRGDLGNDNDHGNDDIVPPKGLPKGRRVNGSSKMSTGNALLLLDRKQKIMTLEST
ncbi:unnamed protein product [Sphagnum jensenii]|uniref:Uncharacterized protein n=1 Tax=Sphagnum jensenii TaxID=128206 RepID=A0ABP0XI85_9BRYO